MSDVVNGPADGSRLLYLGLAYVLITANAGDAPKVPGQITKCRANKRLIILERKFDATILSQLLEV